MRRGLLQGCAALVSLALVVAPVLAQAQGAAAPPAAAAANSPPYNAEQLDALLAPIALYPDDLLAQVLMASTFALQIVEAARWRASGANKDLTGDALAKALQPLPWDPSVKSLVPFPQVLDMMDQNLDWTQQLGYAVSTQQPDVMDSVQRLRRQAQAAGSLQSNQQQVVSTTAVTDDQGAPTAQQAIVIQPANPQVVYVPTYNPAVVYGAWPYPVPPVYLPPPPGYAIGAAFATGLAFAAGAAVVGSLWGWATPHWGGGGWGGRYGCCGGGSVNVNTNRYNNITVNNVNRANFTNNRWQPQTRGPGSAPLRPPGGPIGAPARMNGLPANAIGRPNVQVPAQAVNRPNIGGANRPNAGPAGANRPNAGAVVANRPNAGAPGANRPNAGPPGANRPNAGAVGANRPNPGQRPGGGNFAQGGQARGPAAQRPSGAFGGVNEGARAAQFQQRGAQSRSFSQQSRPVARGGGGGGGPRRRS